MRGGVGSLRHEVARAIVASRRWIVRGNEKSPARAGVPRIKKARLTSGRPMRHVSLVARAAKRSAGIASTWQRSAVKVVALVAPVPDGVPLPSGTSQWSKIEAASPARRVATRRKPAEGRPRASRPIRCARSDWPLVARPFMGRAMATQADRSIGSGRHQHTRRRRMAACMWYPAPHAGRAERHARRHSATVRGTRAGVRRCVFLQRWTSAGYLDFPLSVSTLQRWGAVAQLGERCNRTAEVRGSTPLSSMLISPTGTQVVRHRYRKGDLARRRSVGRRVPMTARVAYPLSDRG
jgi:hypothetical protein